MDPAEHNDVRVGLRRLLGQAERIPDKIRHVLDFRHLVVMGEDDGVQPALEIEDLHGQRLRLRARHRLAKRRSIRAALDWNSIRHGAKLASRRNSVNARRALHRAQRGSAAPPVTLASGFFSNSRDGR